MNNKEELKQQVKELEDKLNELKQNVEDIEEDEGEWKPKPRGTYYYVLSTGGVIDDSWMGYPEDIDRLTYGNVFKTKEEAEKERDRRLAEAELLEMCEFDVRYSHATFAYNFLTGNFETSSTYKLGLNPYRFSSERACKEAIDKLGKEKLKLIFRIRDLKDVSEETYTALKMLMGE